ncbi:MAG TPA: hypothetical protein VNN77_00510 [candidate division Zixibacteria bacterium]|nr:hypothetical protein [candidate division Zixibacteria bacterium]
MAQPKLRFYFREPAVDTNRPLTEGTVRVEGFDFEIVGSEEEADAWDCGFAARIVAHAKGAPHLSIPAFPNRKFRLSYIFVNSGSGIGSPRDLAGRRVGIMQWDNTAGVWARGALQHYYGVDLASVRWMALRVKEGVAAPGMRIEKLSAPTDADPDEILNDCWSAGRSMRSSAPTFCPRFRAGIPGCGGCSRTTNGKSRNTSGGRESFPSATW